MKTIAVLLAACFALLMAPAATAECPGGVCPEDVIPIVTGIIENYPHCTVVGYSLDPVGHRVDPDCLFPLPP